MKFTKSPFLFFSILLGLYFICKSIYFSLINSSGGMAIIGLMAFLLLLLLIIFLFAEQAILKIIAKKYLFYIYVLELAVIILFLMYVYFNDYYLG